MGRKILGTVALLSMYLTSFATGTLDLVSDRQEVAVGDTFNVQILYKNEGSLNLQKVGIEGIENFSNLGESNSTRMVIENGKAQTEFTITLTLQAKKSGTFTLGPAEIAMGAKSKLSSGKISIKVLDGVATSTGNIQNSLTGNQAFSPDNTGTLQDIKVTENSFSFNGYYALLILFLIFLGIFYYVINIVLSQTPVKKVSPKVVPSEPQEDSKSYFIKALQKLQKDSESLDRSTFFSRLNFLQREFLEHLGVASATRKTIEELQKDVHNARTKNALRLLERSYLLEFQNIEDSQELRSISLEEFRNIL